MKTVACILLSFINSLYLFAQTDIDSLNDLRPMLKPVYRTNNMIGLCSMGAKNTYGFFGIFFGRNFDFGKNRFDVRLGCGIKDGFIVGGGIDVKVYGIKQRIEFFVAGDYSYQYGGTIRYDDEKKYQPYTSDMYTVSACQYAHTYLNTRFFIDKDLTAALQLKTGYAFLLNDVSIMALSGPDVNYSRAEHSVKSGLMLGFDFIIYIKFFEDFKRRKYNQE